MKAPSSLNQMPDESWSPMSELIARRRTFCAASSACGATHSPMTKVATRKAAPILASVRPARPGEKPEPRITVYSELLARCEST
jgi:hypothetical protein